jgi:predicted nucleic acid-binding protein
LILADTSVWVRHLRADDEGLARLLAEGRIACHPFVIGELSCGALRRRAEILGYLAALPATLVASHEEALHFAAERKLHGKGLGWIDVHLLASAVLSGCRLWTLDRTLASAAKAARVEA